MEDKKLLQKAKNIFTSLKTDPNSVLFSEEKTKYARQSKDSLLLKLFLLADSKPDDEGKVPIGVDYVQKREIDRSTLCSFDGSFQMVHADMGNLEFLGKSATIPRYVLLWVDLYSSKLYVYRIRLRKQILQKMILFYNDIKNKRNSKTMTL